jgi:hypothetical protein
LKAGTGGGTEIELGFEVLKIEREVENVGVGVSGDGSSVVCAAASNHGGRCYASGTGEKRPSGEGMFEN